MKTLLALVAVCVATVGAQHIWPYGVPGILPQVAPVVAVKEPSTVVVKSLVESPVQVKGLFGVPVYPQYPHVVQVAIPSQDTTRGMPQPVEDTPEVKSAKALFAKEYEKAAIAAALAPEVRKRRDLTSEMKIETTPADTMRLRTPMQYPWPIVSHHMTAPWQLGMYGHPGMPLITAPGK